LRGRHAGDGDISDTLLGDFIFSLIGLKGDAFDSLDDPGLG